MKPRLTPIEIHLKDLPPEGRTYLYTRESGELNESLGELIGANPYEVQLQITPAGNSFDLRGHVRTAMDLQCSLCAIDFKFPVQLNLHELLLEQKPMAKGDQLVKTNHAHEWESEGPDYIMLDSDVFQVGEYVHEMIALTQPMRPLGKPNCDMSCENITEPLRTALGKGEKSVKSSPFQVLEKIKLKS